MIEKIRANPKVLNSKAPTLTASSWGLYDVERREIVYGKLVDTRREVASVTKTMTAYTVCELGRKYNLNLSETYIKVCKLGSRIIGSSAKLRFGDVLTVE